MRSGVLLFWLISLSACSNPFSGGSDRAASYHTPNVNCQDLKLDADQFDARQLRAVVHCLNSDGQIQELEDVLAEIQDTDLSPLASLVNSYLAEDVASLFTIESAYQGLKSKQLLRPALQALLPVTQISAITPAADIISEVAFDPNLHLEVQNLEHYFQSAAMKRLIREHKGDGSLRLSIRLLYQYLKNTQGFSLRSIIQKISKSKVSMPVEPSRLEGIASFFELIFATPHFEGFSRTAEQALTQSVRCFDRTRTIRKPTEVLTQELSLASPAQAKVLFDSEFRLKLMTARSFCDIPFSVEPVFRLTDVLTRNKGFELSYRFLLPLVNQPWFVDFLSQSASREWVKQSNYMSKGHTTQDLMTLIALHESLPLTNAPILAATYFDRLFETLSAEEIVQLVEVAEVFFQSPDQTPLLNAVAALPTFDSNLKNSQRDGLQRFARVFLKTKNFARLLAMVQRLIQNDSFIPIWDQVFALFRETIQKGKHSLNYPKAVTLNRATQILKVALLKKDDAVTHMSSCSIINTDLSMTSPSLRKTPTWLAMDACFGASPANRLVLKNGKTLWDELELKKVFNDFTQLETDLLNGILKVDAKSGFDLVAGFVGMKQYESDILRKNLDLTSKTTHLLSPTLLKSPGLRSLLGKAIAEPDLYLGMIDLNRNAPTLLKANTFEVTPQSLQADIQGLMKEYCPSVDIQNRDCDLDDDQVLLFRENPLRLAQQVISESLDRSQTWLHPKLTSGWTPSAVPEVQNFNYHFNPLLHELRIHRGLGAAIFDFFGQYKGKTQSLKAFVQTHARNYSVIPYVYQLPTYPRTKPEFHRRIRIKLVSDLDRLELVAINTDFRPLGMGKNIGLKFIRDIALAWGDEPAHLRPSGSTSQTLAQVTAEIQSAIKKFDRESLQKLGQCDPRGKSRIGKWLQNSVCKTEIADLAARVFNLRSVATLFDVMQVKEAGGNDGLRLLRNLFFALYRSNLAEQSDRLGDGADIPSSCISAPSNQNTPNECKFDQLTLISRVTRLGLLHQAGLSSAFTTGSSVNEALDVLSRVGTNTVLKEQISSWLILPSSSTTLLSLRGFVQTLPDQTANDRLHHLLRTMSSLGSDKWISSLVTAFGTDPLLVQKLSKPLYSLATLPLESAPSTSALDRSPRLRQWLQSLVENLDARTHSELAAVIVDLGRHSTEVKALIEGSQNIPAFNRQSVISSVNDWLFHFAQPDAAPHRASLSRFVTGSGLEKFCDVFSDSTIVSTTYNFLEEIHQNPDSDKFFATCKAFLFH